MRDGRLNLKKIYVDLLLKSEQEINANKLETLVTLLDSLLNRFALATLANNAVGRCSNMVAYIAAQRIIFI